MKKRHKKNNKNPETRKITFEKLEDRIYFSASPAVNVQLQPNKPQGNTNVVVNQQFQFQVSLTNQGQSAAQNPYVDVFFQNGLNTNNLQASVLGKSINLTQIHYNAQGVPSSSSHPLTDTKLPTDPSRANGTLVVAELPFGTYMPNQTPLEILFSGTEVKSGSVPYNTPLGIQVVGGFEFGSKTSDNASNDPSLTSLEKDVYVTPTIYSLVQTTSLQDNKVGTGASNKFDYILTLNLAKGQTLSDLSLTDTLFEGFNITGLSISGTSGYKSLTLDGHTLNWPTANNPCETTSENTKLCIDFGKVETSSSEDNCINVKLTGYLDDSHEGTTSPLTCNFVSHSICDGVNLDDQHETSTITVKQPKLDLTNELVGNNCTGQVGDTFQYKITINQDPSSTSNAYNLLLNDVLSSGLTYAGGLTINGHSSTQGTIGSNNNFQLNIPEFDLGAGPIVIAFNVKLNANATCSQSSVANLSYQNGPSVCGSNDIHTYTVQACATCPITPTFQDTITDKVFSVAAPCGTVINPCDPNALQNLSIGEHITYEIDTTFAPGTTTNAIITDALSTLNGLISIDSATISSIGSNLHLASIWHVGSAGILSDPNHTGYNTLATFNLGTINNTNYSCSSGPNDTIKILVTGTVVNVSGNTAGDKIDNISTLTAACDIKKTADVNVTLVEPKLDLTNELVGTNCSGQVGDTFQYKLTISQDSHSTSNAYNLLIDDILSSGLTYAGGLTINGHSSTQGTIGSNNNLQLSIPELDLGAGPIVITFNVKLNGNANCSQSSVANLCYTSEPCTGTPNNTRTYTVQACATCPITPTFQNTITDKVVSVAAPCGTVINSCDPNALQNLSIGEHVTYEIDTTFACGTTPNAVITDALSTLNGLISIDSATISAIGSNLHLSSNWHVGSTGVLSDPNHTGYNTLSTFNLGTVANTNCSCISGPNDTLKILVTGTVIDVSANTAGDKIDNISTLTAACDIKKTADVNVTLVEPKLDLSNQLVGNNCTGQVGDTFQFKLTISQDPHATSNAYDLVLNDVLSSGLTYAGGLTINGTPATGTIGSNNNLQLSFSELDLGAGPIVIMFNATLNNTLSSNSSPQSTTATLTYASEPCVGTPDNTRTYVTQCTSCPITPVFNYNITKNVVSTSLPTQIDPSNPNLQLLTIGEEVTYEIVATIPKGTSSNTIITDTLNELNGIIGINSATVSSIGSNLTNSKGLTVGSNGILTDLNNNGYKDLITFNFGTVVNSGASSSTSANTIKIRVTGTVLNLPVNVSGDIISDTAKLATACDTKESASLSIKVVEPKLNITKTIIGTDTGTAGTVFTYQITVNQDANSKTNAYDVIVNDVLDSQLKYLGNVQVSSGSVTPIVTDSNHVQFNLGDLPLGSGPIVFTFNATFKSSVSSSTPPQYNTATLIYDTLPTEGGEERDYCKTVKSPPITPNFQYDITKAIVSTSLPTQIDPSNPNLQDLTIGEQVTYEIVATIPKGTSSNTVITDTLNELNGIIGINSATISAIGSNLTNSTGLIVGSNGILTDLNHNGYKDLITFNFGTVVNSGASSAANANTIKILVTGTVLNLPVNVSGDIISDTAKITTACDTKESASLSIKVVEPKLDITKTIIGANTGSAGTVFTYQITVNQNPSSVADAYDVFVNDVLDPQLKYLGNVHVISGAVTPTVTDLNHIQFNLGDLPLGSGPVIFTFNVTFKDSVTGSTPPQYNTATVIYDTLPTEGGEERDYSKTVKSPPLTPTFDYDITKTIVSTSLPTQIDPSNPNLQLLNIGEQVTYEIDVVMAKGSTDNTIITDTLNELNGIIGINSATISAIGSNLTNSKGLTVGSNGILTDTNNNGYKDLITFNFGTVLNNGSSSSANANTIKILVTGTVLNISSNVSGDIISDTAKLSASCDVSKTATASVKLIEPKLDITKTIIGTNTGTAGTVFTYQITVNQNPSSVADAYDVFVNDVLDPQLKYLGNIHVISGSVTPTVTDPNHIQFDLGDLPLGSGPVIFTFNVTFKDSVTGSTPPQYNTATVIYDTLPTEGGEERDYSKTVKSPPLTPTFDYDITKTIVSTSLPTQIDPTNPNLQLLNIGEQVTYEIDVVMAKGTSANTVVTDTLSELNGIIGINSATISAIGSNLSNSNGLVVGSNGILTDINHNGYKDLITFNFGTVVNTGSNSSIGANTIKILVTGTVLNIPSNVSGDIISDTAKLTTACDVKETSAVSIKVIEPNLDITKTIIGTNVGDDSTIFTYQITVNQNPNSKADAYDVFVNDVLDSQLKYLGNLQVISGSVTPTVTDSNHIKFSLGDMPLGSGPVIFTFNVTFKSSVTNATPPQYNTATVFYDTLPTEGGEERDYCETVKSPPITPNLQYDISKTIVSTSLPTQIDPTNPNLQLLTIGEQVTYEIDVALGKGTTADTIVTDTLNELNGIIGINSATISAIGSNLTNSNGFVVGSNGILTDLNHNGYNDLITFNFGTVVNNGASSAANASMIKILVTGTVLNLPANVSGDIIPDTARLTAACDVNESASASIKVAEPKLDITKTLIGPNVGDDSTIFTYQITLSQNPASTTNAYDVIINDILDSQLEYLGNLQVLSGSVSPTVNNSNNVEFAIGNLPLGSGPVIFTFEAKFKSSVTPSTPPQYNTATVTYDTLPTEGGEEREYSGTATSPAVTPDLKYEITKDIVSTSLPTQIDPNNPILQDLTIGEQVTYEINVSMAKGTSYDTVITDTLSELSSIIGINSATISAIGSNLTNSNGLTVGSNGVLSDPNNNGYNNLITFNFGTVINNGASSAANDSIIKILVTGTVLDIPGNVSGDTVSDVAGLVTSDVNKTATTTSNVVAPDLTITKTLLNNNNVGDAGDVFTYQVVINHATDSTANAYNVLVKDLIPSGLDYIGNLQSISGATPVVDNSNPSDIIFSFGSLPLGSGPIVFNFDVKIDNSVTVVTPPQVNVAKLDYSSLPSLTDPNDRATEIETQSGPIEIAMNYDIAKSIVSTSNADTNLNHLSIGETVTYEIDATFAEGTTNNVFIIDSVPTISNGILNITNAQISFIGSGITNTSGLVVGSNGTLISSNITGENETASFDFGTILNAGTNRTAVSDNDRIKILVTAVVVNKPENVAGTTIENDATLTFTNQQQTYESKVTTDIVEPKLDIVKTANVTSAEMGDTITYTLTINHDPTSTAFAYDINLTDAMVAGLTLNPASITVNGANVLQNSSNPTSLALTLDKLALGNNTITITYKATVGSGFQLGNIVPNTANLTYDTQPSSVPEERQYSTSANYQFDIVGPDLRVTKSTTSISVQPGNTLNYVITLTNKPGEFATTAFNVSLVDFLPQELSFLSSTNNGSINAPTLSGQNLIWTIPSLAPGATITFNISTLVKPDVSPNTTLILNITTATLTPQIDPTPQDNTAFTDTPITFPNTPPTPPTNPNLVNPILSTAFGTVISPTFTLSPILASTPLYSGSATPGSTLIIEIRNSLGQLIGTQSSVADAGGNWVARFPVNSAVDNLSQIVITQVQSTQAQDVNTQAFTLFYNPVSSGGVFTSKNITSGGALKGAADKQLKALYSAALNPVSEDWSEASYDYFGPQGSDPTGY